MVDLSVSFLAYYILLEQIDFEGAHDLLMDSLRVVVAMNRLALMTLVHRVGLLSCVMLNEVD
jgi:hypothetical protein